MADVPFCGAVLTGGRSTRMGADKALLDLDGQPLAARVAAVLAAAGADPVIAVGGDLDGLRAAGLRAVPDPHEGRGPLGGIATALSVTPGVVTVVLACDLVAASPHAVVAVVDALAAAPSAVAAVPFAARRLQPLHAAWRAAALPVVEEALRAGRYAVHELLEQVQTVTVEGLDEACFTNVNTPADLAAAPRPPATLRRGQTGDMTDAPIPEIDVTELAHRRAEGAFVLDVRQPDEYEAGHIPGAVLVPLDQLAERRSEIPTDRPVLVVCRSGARSAAAVQALTAAGYDATNVAGGTLAWMEAGQPVAEGPAAG